MKKFFLLSTVILIFCLSQKSSAQNISDSKYRGFNLNYNLVKLVLDYKILFLDIKKNKIFVTLDDSLKFEVAPYQNGGIALVCWKTHESFCFYWGKNKIKKHFAGPEYDIARLKKRGKFYIAYDEGERFVVTPQMKSKEAIFFYDKEGNGGFFKLNENGSFIFKTTDSPNTTFSPMDVKEIILLKKRLIDLFIAINAVCKK